MTSSTTVLINFVASDNVSTALRRITQNVALTEAGLYRLGVTSQRLGFILSKTVGGAVNVVNTSFKALKNTIMALTFAVSGLNIGLYALYNRIASSQAELERFINLTGTITGEGFKEINDEVLKLTSQLPNTTKEIASTMYEISKLGVTGKNLTNITKTTFELADVFNEDANTISKLLVVANRMGEDVATAGDKMAKAFQISSLNLQKLKYVMQNAQGTFQSLGFTFTDLLASATLVSKYAEITPTRLGTGLKIFAEGISRAMTKIKSNKLQQLLSNIDESKLIEINNTLEQLKQQKLQLEIEGASKEEIDNINKIIKQYQLLKEKISSIKFGKSDYEQIKNIFYTPSGDVRSYSDIVYRFGEWLNNTQTLSDKLKRLYVIQQIFGRDGATVILTLLNHYKELNGVIQQINNSQGNLNNKFKEFQNTIIAKKDKLKSYLEILGNVIVFGNKGLGIPETKSSYINLLNSMINFVDVLSKSNAIKYFNEYMNWLLNSISNIFDYLSNNIDKISDMVEKVLSFSKWYIIEVYNTLKKLFGYLFTIINKLKPELLLVFNTLKITLINIFKKLNSEINSFVNNFDNIKNKMHDKTVLFVITTLLSTIFVLKTTFGSVLNGIIIILDNLKNRMLLTFGISPIKNTNNELLKLIERLIKINAELRQVSNELNIINKKSELFKNKIFDYKFKVDILKDKLKNKDLDTKTKSYIKSSIDKYLKSIEYYNIKLNELQLKQSKLTFKKDKLLYTKDTLLKTFPKLEKYKDVTSYKDLEKIQKRKTINIIPKFIKESKIFSSILKIINPIKKVMLMFGKLIFPIEQVSNVGVKLLSIFSRITLVLDIIYLIYYTATAMINSLKNNFFGFATVIDYIKSKMNNTKNVIWNAITIISDILTKIFETIGYIIVASLSFIIPIIYDIGRTISSIFVSVYNTINDILKSIGLNNKSLNFLIKSFSWLGNLGIIVGETIYNFIGKPLIFFIKILGGVAKFIIWIIKLIIKLFGLDKYFIELYNIINRIFVNIVKIASSAFNIIMKFGKSLYDDLTNLLISLKKLISNTIGKFIGYKYTKEDEQKDRRFFKYFTSKNINNDINTTSENIKPLDIETNIPDIQFIESSNFNYNRISSNNKSNIYIKNISENIKYVKQIADNTNKISINSDYMKTLLNIIINIKSINLQTNNLLSNNIKNLNTMFNKLLILDDKIINFENDTRKISIANYNAIIRLNNEIANLNIAINDLKESIKESKKINININNDNDISPSFIGNTLL